MTDEQHPNGTPASDDRAYVREDDRWSRKNQARDWGYLAIMIIAYLIWTGIIYLFEPGIR